MKSNKCILATCACFGMLFLTASSALAASFERVIHSFQSPSGEIPGSGLLMDSAGNLYGTTTKGGGSNAGTVYELVPQSGGGWVYKTLHGFRDNKNDGGTPLAGVVMDLAGNLYGTTQAGGTYNGGTVFELVPSSGGQWIETVILNLGGPHPIGQEPEAALVLDSAGNLYGTTYAGGTNGVGVVFELSPNGDGTWTELVLHHFLNAQFGDGANPTASLIFDGEGNLYGTTLIGGTGGCGGGEGCGIVFELTPGSDGWSENILYSFQGGDDGDEPAAALVFDTAGNLYGTTGQGGGPSETGTVYELSPGSGGYTETVIRRFQAINNGRNPDSALIFDSAGNLYGTTLGGGNQNHQGFGTIFRLHPTADGSWITSGRYNFTGGSSGDEPAGGVLTDGQGHFFGATQRGGVGGFGTIYKITP